MMTYLVLTGRIITIMFLFLVMTLITGRRKVGEIPVFDFLVVITLASVVGADIADPEIEHLPTAYAVVVIILMQYLYGIIIMKSRKLGKLLTFEPVVVIENGQFVKANLKRLKYSIDTILMMLREKDVFDVSEVEFAVIESTGQLSVLKKSQYQPISASEIKLDSQYKGLSIPLIVEGEIYEQNLDNLNLSRDWLVEQLKKTVLALKRACSMRHLTLKVNYIYLKDWKLLRIFIT